MIGGLLTSTLLTLVVVPVAYSLVDDLGRLRHRRPRDSTEARPRAIGGVIRSLGVTFVAMVVLAVAGNAVLRPDAPASSSANAERTAPFPTAHAAPTPEPTPVVAADPSAEPKPLPGSAAGAGSPGGTPPSAPRSALQRPTEGAPGQPGAAQPPAPRAASGQAQIGNTNAMGANVREAPGLAARRIAALPEGTPLEQLGETREAGGRRWVKVRSATGAEGWIASDYLVQAAG